MPQKHILKRYFFLKKVSFIYLINKSVVNKKLLWVNIFEESFVILEIHYLCVKMEWKGHFIIDAYWIISTLVLACSGSISSLTVLFYQDWPLQSTPHHTTKERKADGTYRYTSLFVIQLFTFITAIFKSNNC